MTLHLKSSIFVLRNNDLGDVLVTTPLLAGLRKAFPEAKISVGVGNWAKSLLENNPDVDEIISCNAPWHNKQNCNFPANSPKTFLQGLFYVLFSKEAHNLSKAKFTHGLDILGSRQGSWLLRRAKITNRFGVSGYAGGDNWCNQCVNFKENRKVADSALAFLPLLGTSEKVAPRPRIFLAQKEKVSATRLWEPRTRFPKRLIIAPGGGFPEKCWGDANYSELTRLLLDDKSLQLFIVGSSEDKFRVQLPQKITPNKVKNLCGKLSLRETAALVSEVDFVITNTSLCMHLAGAFNIPALTLLGEWYDSAKLHQEQWGYSESLVVGKEASTNLQSIATPQQAFEIISSSWLAKPSLNC